MTTQMSPLPDSVRSMMPENIDWERHCKELGDALGLDAPVSREVLQRVAHDDDYAKRLFAGRRHPPLLRALLDSAPSPSPKPIQSLSNGMLARGLANAMGRWASAGFATLPPEAVDRRRAACESCPNLMDAPPKLAYALVRRLDGKVCAACGCAVATKTRFPTEACPEEHPLRPGLTRWLEPLASG